MQDLHCTWAHALQGFKYCKEIYFKMSFSVERLAQKSPKSLSHVNMKLPQYKEGVINFLLLSRFVLLSALAFQTSRQPSSFSKDSFRCVLYFFGMQNWHTFLPLPNSHKGHETPSCVGVKNQKSTKTQFIFCKYFIW